MWPSFPSVTHFSKDETLFNVWPIFPRMTHISTCDQFFNVYHSFPSLPHFPKCKNIFPNVAHFSKRTAFLLVFSAAVIRVVTQGFSPISGEKCAAFFVVYSMPHFFKLPRFLKGAAGFQVWRIFASVAHLSKCSTLLKVCCILQGKPHFSKCHTFPSLAHFSKCDAFSQVCRIFPSVPLFPKDAALFQVICNLPSVPHFSRLPHFRRVAHFSNYGTFLGVPHFSKVAALFQVGAISKCFAFNRPFRGKTRHFESGANSSKARWVLIYISF